MGTVVLALSLLSMALLCPATATLRIGAFNIQSFGDSKMSDESVAGVIINILRRYDVVLVQEVRDSDLSAVTELLEQLNSVSSSPYDYEISGPLGRDNYKEMYLFLYRTDVVSVVDTYQYEDPQDVFSREPFVLRVSAPHSSEQPGGGRWAVDTQADVLLPTEAEEFVMVPLHSAPHDAVAEIDALYDVYLAVVNKWGTDNIVFLGDFNADCSYVKQSDWASIRLRSSDVFKWLIPDSADTTVGKSDCAYDRIVVCGSKLKRSIVPNSATVYNFQRAFQLEQEEVSRDRKPGLRVAAVHKAVWNSKAELPQVQQRQPGTTGLPMFGIIWD
ncbi:deoxyribonuclease-1-like 2 [Coturnix japonica]|uniref:deoxyribonuclease-1-like 2 n=1 Tax=Coturnix japonica TaxID=93934 RepID=UPI0013A5EDE3|nr:deoxyribonuclease-1-like 2 [Coturnix japonica]